MSVWRKLKEKAKDLKTNALALYLALKHPKTGLLPKLIIFITVAYAVSPVDLIPDFIPILGYLDDIIILPLLIRLAISLVPKEVMTECLEKAAHMTGGLKKRWLAASGIFLIWAFILFLIGRKVIKGISKNPIGGF